MRILALSGGLRAGLSNALTLRAARELAPDSVDVRIYDGIGALPAFDPDLESAEPLPTEVVALRDALAAADALLVCCPEYAHGVPGAFKNALDWLVGVGLGRRPVGLVDIAPRSHFVQVQLREILTTMDGALPDATQVTIDFAARPESVAAIVADSRAAAALVAGNSAMLHRLDQAPSS